MSHSFRVTARLKSVSYAVAGLRAMLVSEHNARIHTGATLGVLVMGLTMGVTSLEWCLLVLAVMSVWTAEALNTAFEFLADVASPGYHPLVKKSKDVAAGAVLVSAAGSVVIGLIVFGPRILQQSR